MPMMPDRNRSERSAIENSPQFARIERFVSRPLGTESKRVLEIGTQHRRDDNHSIRQGSSGEVSE